MAEGCVLRLMVYQWLETSNNVFQNIKLIIEESISEIQDDAIDRAHRVGKAHTYKTSGVKYKGIIVGFTTFRHRSFTAIRRI